MAHYTNIFNAIADNILSAWSVQATSGGRTPKPNVGLPIAVITLESVERDLAGRSVEQTWNWSIGGRFNLPTGQEPQGYIADKAEALIDILTPFSENSGTLPTVPTAFGSVGYMPIATSWTPIPLDDADNSCGVLITFSVRTTVWQ